MKGEKIGIQNGKPQGGAGKVLGGQYGSSVLLDHGDAFWLLPGRPDQAMVVLLGSYELPVGFESPGDVNSPSACKHFPLAAEHKMQTTHMVVEPTSIEHPPTQSDCFTATASHKAPLPLPTTAASSQKAPLPLPLPTTATASQKAPLPLPTTAASSQKAPLPLPTTPPTSQKAPLPLPLPTTAAASQKAPLPLPTTAASSQKAQDAGMVCMPAPGAPLPITAAASQKAQDAGMVCIPAPGESPPAPSSRLIQAAKQCTPATPMAWEPTPGLDLASRGQSHEELLADREMEILSGRPKEAHPGDRLAEPSIAPVISVAGSQVESEIQSGKPIAAYPLYRLPEPSIAPVISLVRSQVKRKIPSGKPAGAVLAAVPREIPSGKPTGAVSAAVPREIPSGMPTGAVSAVVLSRPPDAEATSVQPMLSPRAVVPRLADAEAPSAQPRLAPQVGGPRGSNQVMLVLAGPPGSGKSTVSEALIKRSSVRWVHANQDTVSGRNRKNVVKKAHGALMRGANVIIDRCNTSPDQRKDFVALAKETGVELHAIVLLLPLKTCAARVRDRKSHPTLKPGGNHTKIINMVAVLHRLPLPLSSKMLAKQQKSSHSKSNSNSNRCRTKDSPTIGSMVVLHGLHKSETKNTAAFLVLTGGGAPPFAPPPLLQDAGQATKEQPQQEQQQEQQLQDPGQATKEQPQQQLQQQQQDGGQAIPLPWDQWSSYTASTAHAGFQRQQLINFSKVSPSAKPSSGPQGPMQAPPEASDGFQRQQLINFSKVSPSAKPSPGPQGHMQASPEINDSSIPWLLLVFAFCMSLLCSPFSSTLPPSVPPSMAHMSILLPSTMSPSIMPHVDHVFIRTLASFGL
eukprot:gene18705-25228_t